MFIEFPLILDQSTGFIIERLHSPHADETTKTVDHGGSLGGITYIYIHILYIEYIYSIHMCLGMTWALAETLLMLFLKEEVQTNHHYLMVVNENSR